MKALLSVLLCLPLCGCMSIMVPKTTITGSIAGKPFSLTSPKDSELTGLEIKSDTNGAVMLKITSLKAHMSPEVITTTGDSQTKMIQAIIQGVISAMAAAKP